MQEEREEREQYMDSLERQMEEQREQIQHTLDRTTEGSRKAPERPSQLPQPHPGRGAADREIPTKPIRSDTPSGGEKSPRKPSDPRSWWQRTSST
jgi:hypothetical protein